jgi:phosphoglycolate phosphatase
MQYESIIFDMDGTLWDSAESVAKSWNEAVSSIEDVSVRFTADDIKGVMGLTMDVIADKFFGSEDHERSMEIMNMCASHENDYLRLHGGILYDDLETTLAALSRSHRLFIVSNCQQGYIEAFYYYHKLDKYFTDHLCWGDDLLKKGDNIRLIMEKNNVTDALYVGDTQGDCDSAYYAGTAFAYASYGFGKADRFDFEIKSFREMLNKV